MFDWLFWRTPATESDPKDGRSVDGRTDWRHVRLCTECREETGHQEFMTQICLSCGVRMSYFPRDAAVREIYYRGKWQTQLRDGTQDFIREGGKWIPLKEDQAT